MANDGIIATAGLLEGFAGAGLITAATTATLVGMLSGGAEWAEAAAERDGQLTAADEEAAEIAQLESERDILEIMSRAETVRAGLGSAVAYLLGAAIPLIITVLVPVAAEISMILAAVVVSLIVTSSIGARTGHMRLPRVLARALTVGLGTLAISYLAGSLIF